MWIIERYGVHTGTIAQPGTGKSRGEHFWTQVYALLNELILEKVNIINQGLSDEKKIIINPLHLPSKYNGSRNRWIYWW